MGNFLKFVGVSVCCIVLILIVGEIFEKIVIPGARILGKLVRWAMMLGTIIFVIWLVIDLFTRKDTEPVENSPLPEPNIPADISPMPEPPNTTVEVKSEIEPFEPLNFDNPELQRRLISTGLTGIIEVTDHSEYLDLLLHPGYQLYLILSTNTIVPFSERADFVTDKFYIKKKIDEGRIFYMETGNYPFPY